MFPLSAQVVFFRQLAVLTQVGIPLIKSLEASTAADKSHEAIIKEIKEKISQGHTFSNALSSMSLFFSSYVVALIAAGEQNGNLPDALDKVSTSLERSQNLLRKYKGVLTYPFFVISIALLLVFSLVKFVLPTFLELFKGLNVKPPFFTLVVIQIMELINNPIVFFTSLILILGILLQIKLVYNTTKGKLQIDSILLAVPVVKKVVKYVAAARFCQALAELYSNGIRLDKSLQLASQVTDNAILKEQIKNALVDLTIKSEPLSVTIRNNVMFPPIVPDFLAVGEATGDLKKVMIKASRHLNEEAEYIMTTAQSLIEPFIMIVLGFVMGFFILAFFLPVYTAISGFGR